MYQLPEDCDYRSEEPEEENKEVEKTIPLAAAHFEPTWFGHLQKTTIQLFPFLILFLAVTFAESDMRTYLSGEWKVGSTNRKMGHTIKLFMT